MEANQKLEESMSRVVDEEIHDDHHNTPKVVQSKKVKMREIVLTQEDPTLIMDEEDYDDHQMRTRPAQINRYAYESFLKPSGSSPHRKDTADGDFADSAAISSSRNNNKLPGGFGSFVNQAGHNDLSEYESNRLQQRAVQAQSHFIDRGS